MSDMIPVYEVPGDVRACGQISFVLRPADAGDAELAAAASKISQDLYQPQTLEEFGMNAGAVLSGEVSEDELAVLVMNMAEESDSAHEVVVSEIVKMPTEGQVLVLGYVGYPEGVDQWGDD